MKEVNVIKKIVLSDNWEDHNTILKQTHDNSKVLITKNGTNMCVMNLIMLFKTALQKNLRNKPSTWHSEPQTKQYISCTITDRLWLKWKVYKM